MTTYGETDWDANDFSGKKANREVNKDLFLRLAEGANKMRLVTKPYKYICHEGVKPVGDPGFGQKFNCPKADGTSSCPLCDAGHKTTERYFVGVVDRKSGAYKLVDIKWPTFKKIKDLKNEEEWGNPANYDINIKVDKNGGPAGYYTVLPVSQKPLSAEDQVLRDTADLEDLKRRTTPPTTEYTVKRLEKVLKGGKLFIKPVEKKEGKETKTAVVSATKTPVEHQVEESEDDLADVFPAYNADSAE